MCLPIATGTKCESPNFHQITRYHIGSQSSFTRSIWVRLQNEFHFKGCFVVLFVDWKFAVFLNVDTQSLCTQSVSGWALRMEPQCAFKRWTDSKSDTLCDLIFVSPISIHFDSIHSVQCPLDFISFHSVVIQREHVVVSTN